MKDLKYLTAYLVPIICLSGIYNAGWWLYLTPLVVFGMVPLLELWMPSLKTNLDEDQRESKLKNRFFDLSQQLPYGYPTMMIIALFPPLWFALVNKQVPLEMVKIADSGLKPFKHSASHQPIPHQVRKNNVKLVGRQSSISVAVISPRENKVFAIQIISLHPLKNA
jgi:hypothetical protein